MAIKYNRHIKMDEADDGAGAGGAGGKTAEELEAERIAAEEAATAAAEALEALQARKDAGEELSEAEQKQLDDAAATKGSGEDGLVVTIGEPEEDEEEKRVAAAPEWVRNLRKDHRETQRKLKQLEEENAKLKAPAQPKAPVLGAKPTLEGCAYDEAKFETELTAWYDTKRKTEEVEARTKSEKEEQDLAWKKKVDKYNADKTALAAKAKDFPEAETAVQSALDTTQQGIILHGAENPSLLILALGKNQKKLDELAAIKDHVKFAFTVAKMEAQMKVTTRTTKPATPPEKIMYSTAPVSGAVDGALEKLRADAEKTGDYSKVHKYKQEHRQQKK